MDAAVESLDRTCKLYQTCKLTAVKKIWENTITFSKHSEIVGRSPRWPHQSLRRPLQSHFTQGKGSVEKFRALTMIDKATAWPKFTTIHNKTSYHISILFDCFWLCQCPWPCKVVYDNGAEFTSQEFQDLLCSCGIKPVPTTVRNPKSNGMVERVHSTMGDMLCTMNFSGEYWLLEMQRALDAITWAVHTTINPAIKHSPCHLAFNQDMIFHRAIQVNWKAINEEHQKLVATTYAKEN